MTSTLFLRFRNTKVKELGGLNLNQIIYKLETYGMVEKPSHNKNKTYCNHVYTIQYCHKSKTVDFYTIDCHGWKSFCTFNMKRKKILIHDKYNWIKFIDTTDIIKEYTLFELVRKHFVRPLIKAYKIIYSNARL